MDKYLTYRSPESEQDLIETEGDKFIRSIADLFKLVVKEVSTDGSGIAGVQVNFSTIGEKTNENPVHPSQKLLLGFKEAASLLSMTEQALRDLVHKGQGPETVKRGKRVCFTYEGLKKFVQKLPRVQPYEGVLNAINANGAKPLSFEERSVFGS